ncbi:MAG: hypothetical protein IPO92_24385 [Saprospiraceae bacterium]|nr:hypothetical protein [Saprospiraceae bacterium]
MKNLSLVFITLFGFAISCTKETNVISIPTDLTYDMRSMILFMGYDPEICSLQPDGTIKVYDDLFISAGSIIEYKRQKRLGILTTVENRQKVSFTKPTALPWASVANITYKLDNAFSTPERTAFNSGVNAWESSNTNLNFTSVISGGNINVIRNPNSGPGVAAQTMVIFTGGPLSATTTLFMGTITANCTSTGGINMSECFVLNLMEGTIHLKLISSKMA